nr:MAG TPA: hypothetical protein [Caudoviricetes sp.]
MNFHETIICSSLMNIHFYLIGHNISNQIKVFLSYYINYLKVNTDKCDYPYFCQTEGESL